MEIKDIIINKVSDLSGITPDRVNTSLDLTDDLGLDSLDKVELICFLEEEFLISEEVSEYLIGVCPTIDSLNDMLEDSLPEEYYKREKAMAKNYNDKGRVCNDTEQED